MFCGSCGKPLSEGVKFCPECGAPVRRATASPEVPATAAQPGPVTAAPGPAPAPQSSAGGAAGATSAMAAAGKNVEQALLAAPILLSVGTLLVLMTGAIFNFIFDLAVTAAAYAVGYKNFKDGKIKEAKTGALVMAVVVAVFFFISAGQGNTIFVLIDAGATIALVYAWSKL